MSNFLQSYVWGSPVQHNTSGAKGILAFVAPLINSLTATVAATFSRGSSDATVVDFEGIIHQVKADEARFSGSRRVENLLSHSEDIVAANYLESNSTINSPTQFTTNGLGNTAAIFGKTVQDGSSTGVSSRAKVTVPSGLAFQLVIQGNGPNYSGFTRHFVGTGVEQDVSVVSDNALLDWSGGVRHKIQIAATENTEARVVLVHEVQLDFVPLGVTSASEYVSKGVLPAPYHGANVDGVKYFNTDRSGIAIPDETLRGCLLEGESTNYFLNSDVPATQAAMVNGGLVSSTVTVTGTTEITVDGTAVTSAAPYTYTPAATTSNIQVITTGDGTVQFEALPYASSYIKTEATSVTRLADVLSYDFQPNALEGSMVAEINDYPPNTAAVYGIGNNVLSSFLYQNSGISTNDGTTVISYGASNNASESNSAGLIWEDGVTDERQVFLDGIPVAVGALDADGYVAGIDPLGIGSLGDSGSSPMPGNYKNINFYDNALSKERLETLEVYEPEFDVPLLESLVPTTGQDYTYSRASAATFIDNDGVIKTAGIGEARFSGSRRVENLLTASSSATSNWTADICTITDKGDGVAEVSFGNTNARIKHTYSSASSQHYIVLSAYIRTVDGTASGIRLRVNGLLTSDIAINGDWQLIELNDFQDGDNYLPIIQSNLAGTTPNIEVRDIQVEIVSGSSSVTSDRVSKGILPSPYHGANVDGVKYLESPASKGILLEGESTNSILRSNNFANSIWVVSGALTKTGISTTLSPDGTPSYEINIPNVGDDLFKQNVTGYAGDVSVSIWVRTVTGTSQIRVRIGGVASAELSIDESWKRLIDTQTIGEVNVSRGLQASGVIATGSVLIAMAQSENESHASSYIGTEAATVTRLADVLSYDYQPEALLGSMAMVVKSLPNVATPGQQGRLLSSSSQASFVFNDSTPTYASYDGTNVSTYTNIGSNITFGLTWNSEDLQYSYTSGTLTSSEALDTDGFNSGGSPIGVGSQGDAGTLQQQGNYSSLRFYDKAFSQAQMETLTS